MQEILIGLDLSSIDKSVISFLKQNPKVLAAESIGFIHVDEEVESAADREAFAKEISAKVEAQLPKEQLDYTVYVEGGDPKERIANWIHGRKTDLLVLGHKQTPEHEVEAKKLVQKPACSILLIPEKENYKINRVGVPLDFSELSKKALEEAVLIAEAAGAELIGFHSFHLPSGYHKSGKTRKEFAAVMEENAKKEASGFLQDIKEIRMEYMHDEGKKPADCILQFAKEQDIDFLVLGSKGRTAAASVLLGSVAKTLVEKSRDIPLMIVKKQEESMGFIDALKRI